MALNPKPQNDEAIIRGLAQISWFPEGTFSSGPADYRVQGFGVRVFRVHALGLNG